jgi:hypothetical protein
MMKVVLFLMLFSYSSSLHLHSSLPILKRGKLTTLYILSLHIKSETRISQSLVTLAALPPVVCRRARALFTLFVYVCA